VGIYKGGWNVSTKGVKNGVLGNLHRALGVRGVRVYSSICFGGGLAFE
jgi:hypothetical protein